MRLYPYGPGVPAVEFTYSHTVHSFPTKSKIHFGAFKDMSVREIDLEDGSVLLTRAGNPQIDVLIVVDRFNNALIVPKSESEIDRLGLTVIDRLRTLERKAQKMLSIGVITENEYTEAFEFLQEIATDINANKYYFGDEVKKSVTALYKRLS